MRNENNCPAVSDLILYSKTNSLEGRTAIETPSRIYRMENIVKYRTQVKQVPQQVIVTQATPHESLNRS